jgi:hypothetical protein
MPEVSIILPLYRNADSLAELCRRLTVVLEKLAVSYEIILVDDACPAGSGTAARELCSRHRNIIALHNEVNLGQNRAVLRGMAHATGQAIVIMDADLQDRPEAIPALLAELSKGSWGAVFAGSRIRHDSRSRLFTSRIFKSLMHFICGVPADSGLFVAITPEVARRVLSFHCARPYVLAMIGCARLPMISIPVERASRPSGKSAYSERMRLSIGFMALTTAILLRCQLLIAKNTISFSGNTSAN